MEARMIIHGFGPQRISRKMFYLMGGFSDPGLFRRMRGGVWCYYAY